MTTSRKNPDAQPPRKGLPSNVEALKLIDQWLENDDTIEDTHDWDNLRMLLDQGRTSGRKLFTNE
jgi:hypothetical protein